MVSGDSTIVAGRKSKFRMVLDVFSKGWERIDIITPATSVKNPITQDGNIFIHPNPSRGKLAHLNYVTAKTKQLLDEHQHDLVTANVYGLCLAALGATRAVEAAQQRPALMLEVHHIAGIPRAGGLRDRIEGAIVTRFLRGRGREADALRVVNTIEMPEYLKKIGYPTSKVMHLPAVFYESEYYTDFDTPKQYDMMFCGRLMPNKGLGLLLDTFEEVRKRRPATTLLIKASGGTQRTWLEQKIARLSAPQNVTLLDWVETPADLVHLYAASRLLICTSYNEGGPRVTIEAMACGTPVISTRVGIMPEMIEHGTSGFLVDWNPQALAQSCLRLLEDPQLAKYIGQAGQQRVQPMTREVVVGRYIEAYQAIARQKSS